MMMFQRRGQLRLIYSSARRQGTPTLTSRRASSAPALSSTSSLSPTTAKPFLSLSPCGTRAFSSGSILNNSPLNNNSNLHRAASSLFRSSIFKRSFSSKPDHAADEWNNIPSNISEKVGRNLHRQKNHPLEIIKRKIENYVNNEADEVGMSPFACIDDLSPYVTVTQNFDELQMPADHESRSPMHTYYFNKNIILRPHTSAHQTELIRKNHKAFLLTGDVYRRDEIDRTHYPVFHQMEGVKTWDAVSLPESGGLQNPENVKYMEQDMKHLLEGLCHELFGNVKIRWVDAYFPFTHPSWELEIFFADKWMEVLGCGIINQKILDGCQKPNKHGWAFGIGLERLAMVLFNIPDIRLFWSTDPRFLSQFSSGEITTFKPYSKYPPCIKDISFWIPNDFHPNNLFEVIRDHAGDFVESVELIDSFTNQKTNRTSHCYRIFYRSMDRNLTNEEINEIQDAVRDSIIKKLSVELR